MFADQQQEINEGLGDIQLFSPPRKRSTQTQLDGYLIRKNASKSKARCRDSSKTPIIAKSARRRATPLSPILPDNDGTGGFLTASGQSIEAVNAKQRKSKQFDAAKRVFDDDITPQGIFLPTDDDKVRDTAVLHPPHDEMRVTPKVMSSPESMSIGFADDPVLVTYRLGRVKREHFDGNPVAENV